METPREAKCMFQHCWSCESIFYQPAFRNCHWFRHLLQALTLSIRTTMPSQMAMLFLSTQSDLLFMSCCVVQLLKDNSHLSSWF